MKHTSLNSEHMIKEVLYFGNDAGIQIISSLIDNPESIIQMILLFYCVFPYKIQAEAGLG